MTVIINGTTGIDLVQDGAITLPKLASNSVNSSKIVDASIASTDLVADEACITPTFTNGWANYGGLWSTCQYYKDSGGIVRLKGLGASGTTTQSLFTLPVGYRPSEQLIFIVMSNSIIARMDIYPDGSVMPNTGISNAWVSLDNISFRGA